jgi:hypothetical protein
MEQSDSHLGEEVDTEGAQDPIKAPTGGAQEPRRKRHTGGKKGARKPSKLLRDMRWCYETTPEEGETLTPGRAMCREFQKKDQGEFLKMLRDLEKALLAGRPKPVPGSSGTGGPASGSSGPTPGSDKGEETTREMIDKLLGEFK